MNACKRLALLALLPVVAEAAPVDERIDAAASGEVEVHTLSGDVVVSGWDDAAVHVTGEISESAERLDVRRDGNRVIIEVVYPDNWRGDGNFGDDTELVIRAPRGSSLVVETVSADVSVSDVEGEQNLRSVSGDVLTETFAAEARLQSVSGDVRVTGSDSAARTSASAVSGDVQMDRMSGEINVESVSGDVEIAGGIIERAELTSVSGDVSLRGELAANARIRADSTSGDVELFLSGDTAADYDLTTFSGEIDNCFGPRPARTGRGSSGASLSFTEGSSGSRVEVSTMSGDIGLCN